MQIQEQTKLKRLLPPTFHISLIDICYAKYEYVNQFQRVCLGCFFREKIIATIIEK